MRLERVTTGTILLGGLALFVDLFLDWQETTLGIGMTLSVGASGWSGWGIAAGIGIVGLLVWEGSRMRGVELTPVEATGAVALALLVLGATAASFHGATILGFGTLHVTVGARSWPAYVGLVLAAVVAAAALLRLLAAGATARRTPAPSSSNS